MLIKNIFISLRKRLCHLLAFYPSSTLLVSMITCATMYFTHGVSGMTSILDFFGVVGLKGGVRMVST